MTNLGLNNCDFKQKSAFLSQFMPNLVVKQNFSDKLNILLYNTKFLPTFSEILENLVINYFSKVPKTIILGRNM